MSSQETLSQHNVRLLTALIRYRFREWTVRGCIAIKEIHPDGTLEQVHVFNHWQYLAIANDEQALDQLLIQKIHTSFDAHIYKLQVKYMDKGGRYNRISKKSRQVVAADAKLTHLPEFDLPSPRPREPLPILGLRQFEVGQSKSAAWVKSASAPTPCWVF